VAKKKDTAMAIVRDLAAWSPWDSCWVCRGNNPKKYPYTKCGEGCLGHRARTLLKQAKKGGVK